VNREEEMIKTRLTGGGVLVTFELPAAVATASVHLCGEFNDWSASHPLTRTDTGRFHTAVDLQAGRRWLGSASFRSEVIRRTRSRKTRRRRSLSCTGVALSLPGRRPGRSALRTETENRKPTPGAGRPGPHAVLSC
jgi:hypothetical protein